MRRRSFVFVSLGAALFGMAPLTSSAAPVRPTGIVPTPLFRIEGVVSAATDDTLQIRPPIGDEVTLTVNDSTQIPRAVRNKLEGRSLLMSVGLYAHATYRPDNQVAVLVILTPPVPLAAAGLVDEVAATGFTLALRDGRKLRLVVDRGTLILLNGRPAPIDRLAQGDRAEVLFLLEPSRNRALRVNAQMAPPRSFDGIIATLGTDSFSATGRVETLTFLVNRETIIRLNGRHVPLSALQKDQVVQVLYRFRGGSNLALQVNARTPKRVTPVQAKPLNPVRGIPVGPANIRKGG